MNRKGVLFGGVILLLLIYWHETRAADFQTVVSGSAPLGSVQRDSTTVWTDDDLTADGGLFNGALVTIKGYPDSLGRRHNATVSGLTSTYFEMSTAWPYGDLANAKITLQCKEINYGANGLANYYITTSDSLYMFLTVSLDSLDVKDNAISISDIVFEKTTVATPGVDTEVPTEKAVRDAIVSAAEDSAAAVQARFEAALIDTSTAVDARLAAWEGTENITTAGTIATGTWASDVTLGSGDAITYPAPGTLTDGQYTGEVITLTAGYGSTAFGDIVYLNNDDSKFEKTDSDAAATAADVLVGIVLEVVAEDASCLVLLKGNICHDAWNWTVPGGSLWLDDGTTGTAGLLIADKPDGDNDIIRPVAFALDDDTIRFTGANAYSTYEATP